MTAGVYFIRAKASGLIKIGYSGNVEARLSQLQTGSAETLELAAVVEGPPELERALHRAYAEERFRGEWFRPSMRLRTLVEGVRGERETRVYLFDGLPAPTDDWNEVGSLYDRSPELFDFKSLEAIAFNLDLNGSSNLCMLCWENVSDQLIDHSEDCPLLRHYWRLSEADQERARKLLDIGFLEAAE